MQTLVDPVAVRRVEADMEKPEEVQSLVAAFFFDCRIQVGEGVSQGGRQSRK